MLLKSRFVEMFGDPNSNNNLFPIKKIKEFAECIAGATPSTKVDSYWENGTIPWMSSGEVNKGRIYSTDNKITEEGYKNSSTKLIPAHTVVIAMAGQGKTRGMVGVAEIELCTNQSLCSVITNETVLTDYLYSYLQLKYDALRNASNGSAGRGGLNLKLIGDFPVTVPPIELQKKYIATVNQLDKLKVILKQIDEKFELLKKSRYVELFGEPNTNSLNLPLKRFDEICENLDSKRIPITSSDRKEGKYPYYGASGVVDWVDEYIFDEDLLLISEDGANLVARVSPIAFSVKGKTWVNNHAHVLRFKEYALQKYVEFYFNSINISSMVSGTAQPKLNQKMLNERLIPIPSKEKLEEFTNFWKQLDKLKVETIKKLMNLIE